MTVKELITELQRYPEDKDVLFIEDYDRIQYAINSIEPPSAWHEEVVLTDALEQ